MNRRYIIPECKVVILDPGSAVALYANVSDETEEALVKGENIWEDDVNNDDSGMCYPSGIKNLTTKSLWDDMW